MENTQAPLGVKDTQEAIIGTLKFAGACRSVFADGLQATDIVQIFAKIQADPKLSQALIDAYNGAGNIDDEIKDMSLIEGLSMVPPILEEIKNLIKPAN